MARIKGRAAIEKKNIALRQLKIEYVLATAITPNTYNPNRQSDHDFELLIRSMAEDGFTQPIIVQQATKEIVDGEHRWTGVIVLDYLRRNKLPLTAENILDAKARRREIIRPDLELPVVFVEMTPEQMRIATLRHNRARGSEDIELVSDVLRDLRELGALDWAQDSLMLDDVELQKLLEDVSAADDLAAEEFAEAWEPLSGGGVAAVAGNVEKGNILGGTTAEALDRRRVMETRIAAARTEEEKQAAKKDADLYRVVLTFTGAEGEVVKRILGNRPAEKVLELCQREAAAG
jgi:hypothetical protein